jgi:hypothetical protein
MFKSGTKMTNSHDVDEQSNETEAESPHIIAPIQGGDHATTSDTQEPFQGGKGIALNETIMTYMECEYVEPTFEDEQSNETEAESPDVIAPIQGGDHATCEYVEPTFEDEQSNETEEESPGVIAPIQGGDQGRATARGE